MLSLEIPGTATPTSLSLPEGMDIEDWLAVGETLKWMERSVQWWVGDWMAYGERNYGEDVFQAIDRADGTFDNWKSVANRVSPSRRREDLSFSHHVEVAALEPEEQAEWLQRAAPLANDLRPEMTTRELRNAIQEDGFGRAEVMATVECDKCHGSGRIPVEKSEG